MCDWNIVNENNEVVGTIYNVETECTANDIASKFGFGCSAKPISTESPHRNLSLIHI